MMRIALSPMSALLSIAACGIAVDVSTPDDAFAGGSSLCRLQQASLERVGDTAGNLPISAISVSGGSADVRGEGRAGGGAKRAVLAGLSIGHTKADHGHGDTTWRTDKPDYSRERT